MNRALVVMARAPSAPGKTRLTSHLPNERARALREALLLDTLDCARAVGLTLTVAFTPDDARDEMVRVTGGARLIPQRGVDLGERMANAMTDALDGGAGMVALIGSDLPTLPPEYVNDAFTMLGDADVVFGPTEDGGFYLVASRSPVRQIFRGIDWGSSTVLDQVVRAAVNAGMTTRYTRPWFDVDTPDDLERLTNDTQDEATSETQGQVTMPMKKVIRAIRVIRG